MKITCQSCNSKYNVADEKVHGKTVKIRCRKCEATIVVHGAPAAANGSAPAPEPVAPPARSEDAQWHVNVADNDQRTMSFAELVSAYETGVVSLETFVWTDGMDDWRAISDVDAVVDAAHAATVARPSPMATQAPSIDASRAPSAAPALPEEKSSGMPAGYNPAAAAQEPAPSSGGQFGREMAAMAPEPRRAAVVKREARARDLFGTNVGEDMQTSAQAAALLAPQPPPEDGKLTGQRNENSVLFSLEVLTKTAEQRAPQESKGSTKDDSGIIDLRALAAKAESMRPAAMPHSDTFAPPLAMASTAFAPFGTMGSSAPERAPRSKLPLLIGGGAGVAILVVLGIVIGLQLKGTSGAGASPTATFAPPLATAEVTGAAPTASEPTAAATALTPPASSAPGNGTAAASAKPRASATAWGGAAAHVSGGAAKPAAAGGNAAAGGAGAGGGAAAPAPPKKGGDCGCNGDLMCLMKCSTSH